MDNTLYGYTLTFFKALNESHNRELISAGRAIRLCIAERAAECVWRLRDAINDCWDGDADGKVFCASVCFELIAEYCIDNPVTLGNMALRSEEDGVVRYFEDVYPIIESYLFNEWPGYAAGMDCCISIFNG